MPSNVVIALDVHGTLVSRTESDDLTVVHRFRETISRHARAAGARVVMVSAAPTRELQRVASLLDLGDQPSVAELGHVILPATLRAPPRLPAAITPAVTRMLLDLRCWLTETGLPAGVFLEPKTVLVTLNWGQVPSERDGLVEAIRDYITRRGLPLAISVSDATVDVGLLGTDKVSGLAEVVATVTPDAGPARVIAVGDSRNDLDLLSAASSGLCGCPANAHAAVKEHVRAAGGVVARHANLAGTLEVLSQLLGMAGVGETPRCPSARRSPASTLAPRN